ncbi:MAG: nucleotide exchange factor GrpE [Promethearchaeota archaeon]
MHEEEKTDQDIEVDLSDEDIEDEDIFEISPEDPLYSQLDEECEKSKELFEKLQRLQAEFDNYRKRMDARFSDVAKFASEDILLKVLDIYDNLLRALEMDFADDPKAAKNGINAIQRQFEKMLSLEGVRPIESVGKEFDPYYQHAVQKVYNHAKPDGVILEEFQRGYMLKEKVLRPAVVCVNRHEDITVETSNDDDDNDNLESSGE